VSAPDRWSMMKHRGRDAPKGSVEALERAMAELGPLTTRHEPKLEVLCPCEACVETNIRGLATEFNARSLLIEGAPRRKTVVDNLRRVAEAATELAAALVALDDYSRKHPLIASKYLQGQDPITRAYKTAEGMHLPTPETEENPASDGVIVPRLLALHEYVSWRVDELAGWSEPDTPVDKGGNTNLLKERFGPPAWYIVRHAWVLFENCKPGEATASENGPFLRFVNHVYEYATGETEENSTLLNWIKKLARLLRHHDLLLQRLGPLEVELDDLKLDPPTPERDARIAQLEATLPALRQEVVDAFLVLGHCNFRQRPKQSTG
jgi:hypothetical protein